MNFFDPHGDILQHGETLPHWQQDKVMQFVTFRLGDSLPRSLLQDWLKERQKWLAKYPQPWEDEIRLEYHKKFSGQMERWLDQGMGSCLFADPHARTILADCLMKFEGERVQHQAWVIMPNHVHLLFSPMVPIEKLIQAWKSHTARVLGRGPIWQRDYFDTMIRNSDHFANVLRYIRRNPVKARLREGSYTVWERGARTFRPLGDGDILSPGGQDVRGTQPSK